MNNVRKVKQTVTKAAYQVTITFVYADGTHRSTHFHHAVQDNLARVLGEIFRNMLMSHAGATQAVLVTGTDVQLYGRDEMEEIASA